MPEPDYNPDHLVAASKLRNIRPGLSLHRAYRAIKLADGDIDLAIAVLDVQGLAVFIRPRKGMTRQQAIDAYVLQAAKRALRRRQEVARLIDG